MANTPNYHGLFLRGYGSQAHLQHNGEIIGTTWTTHDSGVLGQIQGDALRNIYGGFHMDGNAAEILADQSARGALWGPTGAFVLLPADKNFDNMIALYSSGTKILNTPVINFQSYRILATANENRPVNTAVRYLVRCR